MQSGTSKKTSYSSNGSGATNPFARALAEAEKTPNSQLTTDTNTHTEAHPTSEGVRPPNNQLDFDAWQAAQQKELKQKESRRLLRRKLHDAVQPATDVFVAQENKVAAEIKELQYELMHLDQEIKAMHKDVDISVRANVAKPGLSGVYYKNVFHRLRIRILSMIQAVRSARTWLQQSQMKQKKRRHSGPGMVIEGGGAEQTKTVFDMMHHERNQQYGAG